MLSPSGLFMAAIPMRIGCFSPALSVVFWFCGSSLVFSPKLHPSVYFTSFFSLRRYGPSFSYFVCTQNKGFLGSFQIFLDSKAVDIFRPQTVFRHLSCCDKANLAWAALLSQCHELFRISTFHLFSTVSGAFYSLLGVNLHLQHFGTVI